MPELLIGGGNIQASADKIFGRFVRDAGGKDARIAVIAAASAEPLESYEAAASHMDKFTKRENIVCVPLTLDETLLELCGWLSRGEEALLPYFEKATAVWFTGGDQLRITRCLLDTPCLERIRSLPLIGGSSAGAAIMPRFMIGGGTDTGARTQPVTHDESLFFGHDEDIDTVLVTNGLGFLPDGLMIDQHFNTRPRLMRLQAAMRDAGQRRAFGISEDTALLYHTETGEMQVLGSADVLELMDDGKEFHSLRHFAAKPLK